MTEKIKCILCEKDAESTHIQGKDGYLAECAVCGKYFLASPELFKDSYTSWPKEKRTMLSAHTRNLFELGEEPPELESAGLWEKIITEYEFKTLDKKLENLIWYLRKKSKEYGDEVSFDQEKDYPITYSLSPDGFENIIQLAKDKGLLERPSKDPNLILREDGWKLGTELLKSKKGK